MASLAGMAGSGLLRRPDCFYIDGKWTPASTDARFDVIAPATEKLYLQVAEAGEEDVNRAVAAARAAFDRGPWPGMPHRERAEILRCIGEKLRERADDITQLWPNEMGVLQSHAKIATESACNAFAGYAKLADTIPFEERHHPPRGGTLGLLVREPVGVVAAIIPWNAPLTLLTHKLAPALLAGCTLVIKGSPEAPSIPYIIAEIADSIRLPPGVINVLTADRQVSELLVRHPGIDKVSFTGSTAAGKKIASICGERIARYTLELGGKSAALIMDDFDLELAAKSLVGPAAYMTGQACSSLTRIIVTRRRHNQLVDALSARFGAVKVGDPFAADSQMGPVAMRRQRDRIELLMNKGKEEGAVLALGGRRPPYLSQGYFIEPTVFGEVDNRSTLGREEIFGPVLSVIPADDEAQIVDLANDTPYGLNNSVFTNDSDRAYSVARQLRSGTVGHNVWRTELGISFGGFKQSGVGREGLIEGLFPYLESKTIILNGYPSHVKP